MTGFCTGIEMSKVVHFVRLECKWFNMNSHIIKMTFTNNCLHCLARVGLVAGHSSTVFIPAPRTLTCITNTSHGDKQDSLFPPEQQRGWACHPSCHTLAQRDRGCTMVVTNTNHPTPTAELTLTGHAIKTSRPIPIHK